MGKTSSEVKNRYNAKTYDRVTIVIKKDVAPKVKERAAEKGETVSGYIKRLISADMGGLEL